MKSSENIRVFAEHVRLAPTEPYSERLVRIMLERCATSCPVAVLVRLGECLVDCRREELRGEVEQN